jgi:hypothetical protein
MNGSPATGNDPITPEQAYRQASAQVTAQRLSGTVANVTDTYAVISLHEDQNDAAREVASIVRRQHSDARIIALGREVDRKNLRLNDVVTFVTALNPVRDKGFIAVAVKVTKRGSNLSGVDQAEAPFPVRMVRFFSERGFGFVNRLDRPGQDIFIHVTVLESAGYKKDEMNAAAEEGWVFTVLKTLNNGGKIFQLADRTAEASYQSIAATRPTTDADIPTDGSAMRPAARNEWK